MTTKLIPADNHLWVQRIAHAKVPAPLSAVEGVEHLVGRVLAIGPEVIACEVDDVVVFERELPSAKNDPLMMFVSSADAQFLIHAHDVVAVVVDED